MEWCGWTTSSLENSPTECGCTREECKRGKSKNVKMESVQTEVFNQMRRAQATWIALDYCTLTKASILIPDQEHPPEPLRSVQDLRSKASLEPSSSSSGAQLPKATNPCQQLNRAFCWDRVIRAPL